MEEPRRDGPAGLVASVQPSAGLGAARSKLSGPQPVFRGALLRHLGLSALDATVREIWVNYGTVVNKGGMTIISGIVSDDQGSITNEVGATIVIQGNVKIGNNGFVNRGTLENKFSLTLRTLENYGTVSNMSGNQMTFDSGYTSTFHNYAGAKIVNAGSLLLKPSLTIANDGTISNTTYQYSDAYTHADTNWRSSASSG